VWFIFGKPAIVWVGRYCPVSLAIRSQIAIEVARDHGPSHTTGRPRLRAFGAVPGDEHDPVIAGEADTQRLGCLIERRAEGRVDPRDAVAAIVLGAVVRHAPHAVENDSLDEQG
jgi:hypothetical protein